MNTVLMLEDLGKGSAGDPQQRHRARHRGDRSRYARHDRIGACSHDQGRVP
jgi:hypothetical protein